MSEAEIVEHMFSVFDRYWAIVQWWASISFSLILVAYFAADRLSGRIVAVLLLLYGLYSVWVYLLLQYNIDIAYGLIGDLAQLDATVGLQSAGAREVLESSLSRYGTWLGTASLSCTFLACAYYVVHAYRRVSSARMREPVA